AIKRSPSSFTRFTRPPATSSLEITTGIQYCLTSAPIGVPASVRVSSSLSSRLSMACSLLAQRVSVRPTIQRHVAVHPLDVQREPLLVVAPLLVLRHLHELLGLLERLALAHVARDLGAQLLQVLAKHGHVSLAAERAVPGCEDVEVHRLDLAQRVDPVVDVAVGEVAERE